MSRSFKIIGAIAFVTLLIVVAGWFATRPAPALDVTITVIGFTNDFGREYVALAITNHSSVAVSRSTKSWLVEDARTGTRVDCWDAIDGNIPIPRPAYEELGPGESRITNVPVPTNRSPWHAVMWYGPVNWKLRLMEWQAGSDYPGEDIVVRVVPDVAVDRQEFRSDVITPIEPSSNP